MIIERERIKRIFKNESIKFVDIIVILDKNCNADCPLCVAKHIIKNISCKELCQGFNHKCRRCCDRTAGDDEFYAAVADFFDTVNGLNVRVILSGGEPTLSPRLIPTLKILDKHQFGQICIETNGAGLLYDNVSKELLKRKVKIILSRYGITDEENNAVFKYKYGAVEESTVKAIFTKYGKLITVNCIPLKGSVDSGEKLIEYYNYFKALGAADVQFSEAMFDTRLAAANKSIGEAYKASVVNIADLSAELTALGYKRTYDSGGAFRLIINSYNDMDISLTAADMSRLATDTQNDNRYSRYLIYPSGEVGTNYVEMR